MVISVSPSRLLSPLRAALGFALIAAGCCCPTIHAAAVTRKVSLALSPAQVSVGGSATYTVTIAPANTKAVTTVNYSMSGTAVRGTDYTVNGTYGKVVIPQSATKSTVILTGPNKPTNTGTKTATMTLLAGTGYKVSATYKASVLISTAGATPTPTPSPSPTATPSPTPTPSATPDTRPTPTQEIWIAARTDGRAGSGTQADPFDGSTQAKFDAVMFNYYWTYNLGIHLMGAGPFRTDANHHWAMRPGWVLSGDGMDVTTIQMVGSAAGINYGIYCILSDPNISSDWVTIRDLTVDCNWTQLSATATNGAGGEKNISVSAIQLWGSNNLIDHVRSKNTYGSWANLKEQFAISLSGPRATDGTNNVIQSSRAEQPYGNYGNPFALAGWRSSLPHHLITNSKVIGCTAVGLNSGTTIGFTSGGVNLANIKDCVVDGNTFTDCYGAAYQDTGTCDGLQVTNNTVTRGWEAVGLCSSEYPKQNIYISGNTFSVQNRGLTGGSYGIYANGATTSNCTIDHNTIAFDTSAGGMNQFWGITGYGFSTVTISNNTLGIVTLGWGVTNTITGSGITMFGNRNTDGTLIPGLGN